MSTTTTQPLAVTAADAAKLVGLSKRAILLHVASGKLRASRPGRKTMIQIDDLRAWLNGSKVEVANG